MLRDTSISWRFRPWDWSALQLQMLFTPFGGVQEGTAERVLACGVAFVGLQKAMQLGGGQAPGKWGRGREPCGRRPEAWPWFVSRSWHSTRRRPCGAMRSHEKSPSCGTFAAQKLRRTFSSPNQTCRNCAASRSGWGL